jgi:hypothetical protein
MAIQGLSYRSEVQSCIDGRGAHITVIQHLSDQVQAFSAPRQSRPDRPPEIMIPHIWNPRRYVNGGTQADE